MDDGARLDWRDRLIALGARAFIKPVFALPIAWTTHRRIADFHALRHRGTPGVHVTREEVAGIACRVATPDVNDGAEPLIWLHGGGFVMCSPNTHAPLLDALALASGRRVVAPAYRLAPEHPFPAGLEDALAVVRALEPCALGGDSAGANLALGVTAALMTEGRPPERLVLIGPPVDLDPARTPPPGCDEMVLPFSAVRRIFAAYLTPGADPRDPRLSPIHADWTGAPPTLIHAARGELLEGDARALAAKMRAAGVEVALEVWDGVPHDWHMAAGHSPAADRAVARIGDFLRGGAKTRG